MKEKIINKILYVSLLLVLTSSLNAQDLRVIDNKGTKKSINKVNYGTATPTVSSNNVKGDIYIVGTATKPLKTFLFDGTTWVEISEKGWSLTGNTGTDPDAASNPNFLGTIDRKDLVLKTYNIERIRVGDITFAHQGEVLINNPTPNSFPRAHPLIIKGNGTSILSFEDSESNDFWDWSFFKQGHLSIKQRANSAPSLVLNKNSANNVGIAGNPANGVTLDIHGNTRIRNLPAGNTTHSFVVAEPDGDLRSMPSSSVFSNVTQTVTNGNEIARHTAGGNTTIINETITTVAPVAKATANDRTIATYENENSSTSGVAIKESVTSITQATNNTNTQVSASTAKTIATYEDENGNDTNINESISTLAFRKVDNTSPTADQYFLDYKNETGVLNNIDISSLTYKGTKGSVLFIGDDTTIAEKNSQFFWDNDNNRLFIGNTASSWPSSISETKVNINGAVTSRSGFKANNGTASIPSFRFYNDANTGMFNAGTDALAFSTKATEALRIDDSQNVGIGTTTPSKKLDVNGEARIRTLTPANINTDEVVLVDSDNVLKKTSASVFFSQLTANNPPTAMTSRTIAQHSAKGTTTDIKETITTITQATNNTNTQADAATPTAKTIATYKNENGADIRINETVTKIEQVTPTGTAPFNPASTADPTRSADSPGDIKYYNESNPTTNPTRVRVVSTDADNSIKIGSDGGAYLLAPQIKAAGQINGAATIINIFESTVARVNISYNILGNPVNWDYRVTFNNSITTPYVVNATPYLDNASSIARILKVFDKGTTGFTIRITNSATSRMSDTGFMFTVIGW